MKNIFARLRTLFLVLFAVAAAGSAYYQIWIVKPRRDCERKGGWWDGDERVCGTPIDISRVTGRPNRSRPSTSPGSPPAATARP